MSYWLEHIAEPSIRRTTYATYEGDIRLHIIPGIGKRKLKSLQAAHISRVAQQLARNMPVLCARTRRRTAGATPLREAKYGMLPSVFSSELYPTHPEGGGRSGKRCRRRGAAQAERRLAGATARDRRAHGAANQPTNALRDGYRFGAAQPAATGRAGDDHVSDGAFGETSAFLADPTARSIPAASRSTTASARREHAGSRATSARSARWWWSSVQFLLVSVLWCGTRCFRGWTTARNPGRRRSAAGSLR